MARGFWSGLVHGSVLGAAGLLALSLAFPLSRDETAPLAPPAEAPVPPSAPPVDRTAAPAASDSPDVTNKADEMPLAGQVDLPVGSEFGRGGDLAPTLPAPLAPRAHDLGQAEAPAVSAPPAEPAPIAITGENQRPETGRDGTVQDLEAPEPGGAGPDLDLPAALSLPGHQPAPAMAAQVGQDPLPARAMAPDQDPAPATPAASPRAAPDRPETGGPQAPALPAPMPDLSLPPDLSDLRMMERD